ncbi:FABP family protein [Schaalia sp. 19OD2882]|uniref:FABP family protein n=1 Tax=Schaalia sp. 19OD2882 TaxID=2794089 RepID=UPI001C1F0E36|nr:heme-binding beta-barrel domain-containing protein [Schaalia sp. 19OD2882]QWW19807.1 FABP family protein [Schaalia sp. 19OD2882]
MIVIPQDMPIDVAPLAWMLGQWEGWGMLTPDPVADQAALPDDAGEATGSVTDVPVLEKVRAELVGTQLAVTTTVWAAESDGSALDATWDAAIGMSHLTSGDLLWEETLYVRVEPGSGVLPPPGEVEPREFTATGATTKGLGTLWSGVCVGPRVQMASDAVARGSAALPVEHEGRMYGLVAGELLWTQERTVEGSDPAVEISGRLMRVAGPADE